MRQGKLPHSTDARDWADEWLNIIRSNPAVPADRETMVTWFSNAIMAGYDEAMRRDTSAIAERDNLREGMLDALKIIETIGTTAAEDWLREWQAKIPKP